MSFSSRIFSIVLIGALTQHCTFAMFNQQPVLGHHTTQPTNQRYWHSKPPHRDRQPESTAHRVYRQKQQRKKKHIQNPTKQECIKNQSSHDNQGKNELKVPAADLAQISPALSTYSQTASSPTQQLQHLNGIRSLLAQPLQEKISRKQQHDLQYHMRCVHPSSLTFSELLQTAETLDMRSSGKKPAYPLLTSNTSLMARIKNNLSKTPLATLTLHRFLASLHEPHRAIGHLFALGVALEHQRNLMCTNGTIDGNHVTMLLGNNNHATNAIKTKTLSWKNNPPSEDNKHVRQLLALKEAINARNKPHDELELTIVTNSNPTSAWQEFFRENNIGWRVRTRLLLDASGSDQDDTSSSQSDKPVQARRNTYDSLRGNSPENSD